MLNAASRSTASKYKRRPVALLWPPQEPPEPLVPILVSSFRLKTSLVPLKVTGENGWKETVTSLAADGFLVTPVMQSVSPSATRVPFFHTSAARSNLVPTSSPFFNPSHTRTSPSVVKLPAKNSGSAVQVPISFHAFPPANLSPAESLDLAVELVGAAPSRK